jgi:alginate O-acetyltransferase complex protein AlgI
MVFSSLIFLYIFLPIFLLAYYVTPVKYRNIPALIGSYLFYAWGAPTFIFILLISSFFDYVIGLMFETVQKTSKRKLLLVISIILNIGLLVVFKYAGFLTTQLNYILDGLDIITLPVPKIVLPLGISFFTFQKLSYIIDVYRNNVKPARSFTNYALYVSLFPQLIAGPIVRYHDIDQQLKSRVHSAELFCHGLFRFTIGLAKKVLIANYVAYISEKIFQNSEYASTGNAWLATIAFSIQIYFDFSGYSDMAIGLGKMMGFEFLENFNRPMVARNFSEFWKRWHISLCNWMFEYLYVPLGGSRKGVFRTYFNLWVIFLIAGFWHGASWNYVIWGAFHGSMLFFEKLLGKDRLKKIPTLISHLGFIYFYLLSTVMIAFLVKMHSYVPTNSLSRLNWCELVSNHALACLIIGIIISLYPDKFWLKHKETWKSFSLNSRFTIGVIFGGILFLLSTTALVSNGYNPFIYFQF